MGQARLPAPARNARLANRDARLCVHNSLILKYFTSKSLFLKDLAGNPAKSLIPKDRLEGGGRYQLVNTHLRSMQETLFQLREVGASPAATKLSILFDRSS